MGTDLKKMPYYLNEEQIQWVYNTIDSMSLKQKIGQLFVNLGKSTDEAYIRRMVEEYYIGGARYMETAAEKILEQNYRYQKYSRIPLLIATNCEAGGNGACKEGTLVATEAQCGASAEEFKAAYEMGRISGIEATAVGCNWTFSPITDITLNWRNSIVNTRSFGQDGKKVMRLSKAYMDGAHESNILTCCKHFPGDGVEERDQHLVMGINDLSYEEWNAAFGEVYRYLIEQGIETVMVGHIAFPDYSRRFADVREEDILPASLAPELVNGLLRKELGFQGLVITDATHMAGFLNAMPRSRQIPEAIAAGCDMILFFHDPKEDIRYMMEGYRNGIVTEERLYDALCHILGMKAKLGLYNCDFDALYQENQKKLGLIGCPEHHRIAGEIADESITLVKDTQGILPVMVSEKKRARLYYIESAPVSYADAPDETRQIIIEELEAAGFVLDVNESYYEMERRGSCPLNKLKAMEMPPVEEFKARYDVVFVFIHMRGYTQESNVRVKYSVPHSNELPWWVQEVPTICVSLNYTNHLYDLPMMKTYINAYAPTRECIHAAIEKITGKTSFHGSYDENVWCKRWDTRR